MAGKIVVSPVADRSCSLIAVRERHLRGWGERAISLSQQRKFSIFSFLPGSEIHDSSPLRSQPALIRNSADSRSPCHVNQQSGECCPLADLVRGERFILIMIHDTCWVKKKHIFLLFYNYTYVLEGNFLSVAPAAISLLSVNLRPPPTNEKKMQRFSGVCLSLFLWFSLAPLEIKMSNISVL